MRALLVVPLVLLAPLAVPLAMLEGCKGNDGTPGDAAVSSASGSGSISGSASADDAGPHTYGDLTDDEITDALKRKRVIAVVRTRTLQREDVGTKNEGIRYELELIKPLNGSPPSETIQRGPDAWMAVGRVYAVVIDRRYLRLLVRAVEVPEEKIKDFSLALEARIVKIAPIVAASASADDGDDDDPPSPSGSTSGSASSKPSSSASGKPSAAPSAKPTVSTTTAPPKPTTSASAKK